MDSSKPQSLETTAQPPSEVVDSAEQDVVDACDLAALGHAQSLSRKFDIWSILALAFCVLGTWSTFAQVSRDEPFLSLYAEDSVCHDEHRRGCNAKAAKEKGGEC